MNQAEPTRDPATAAWKCIQVQLPNEVVMTVAVREDGLIRIRAPSLEPFEKRMHPCGAKEYPVYLLRVDEKYFD